MKPLFTFASAVTAVLLAVPAARAGDAALERPIRQMVDGFNKGDIKAVKAVHVAAPSIVDEVAAPYAWSGPRAFDEWIAVLGRTEAAQGKTGGKVAIGVPIRESVAGDRAYVVTPSSYTFRQKGRTMRETGTFTFVLARTGPGWKIQAWTWTSPEARAVK